MLELEKHISPISGKEVKKDTVSDVVNYVKNCTENSKLLLLAPLVIDEGRDLKNLLQVLEQQGYARIKMEGKHFRIGNFNVEAYRNEDVFLVVDRIVIKENEDFYNRLADAIQTAFFEGKGICFIERSRNEAYNRIQQ